MMLRIPIPTALAQARQVLANPAPYANRPQLLALAAQIVASASAPTPTGAP